MRRPAAWAPATRWSPPARPCRVELGPGLIESIYDGIQRPLEEIMEKVGNSLVRGVEVPSLDRERVWHFTPAVKTRG